MCLFLHCDLFCIKHYHEQNENLAHILGECMERYFGGALCYGPDIEDGFYYDMWMGDQTVSSESDIPKLEKLYAQMLKEKQPFQRLNVTREQLLEMFKHNPFKEQVG